MADDDTYKFWCAIMGDSEDEESDFEGFSLHQVNGDGDESDVDLDLVVNNDHVLVKFDSESEVSDEGVVKEDAVESDMELPVAAGPSQRKKQKKRLRKEENAVKTNRASTTPSVKPKIFAGFNDQQSQSGRFS